MGNATHSVVRRWRKEAGGASPLWTTSRAHGRRGSAKDNVTPDVGCQTPSHCWVAVTCTIVQGFAATDASLVVLLLVVLCTGDTRDAYHHGIGNFSRSMITSRRGAAFDVQRAWC